MRMVHESLAAAAELAQDGISVEVIDLRTLRPWDTATVLGSVARPGRLVVANEAPKIGSLASDVAAVVAEEAFQHLKAPIVRVCGLDTPIPFSVPLEKIVLPGKDDIAAAVRKVVAS
jgi:pyruvate/2-oxoglutarate/acetoin dehydrogenase E1 component